MTIRLAAGLFVLLWSQGALPADDRLAYVSDYFSFVGADGRGRVAFALDTNRGQDGASFQAEHFAVLHAQGTGWQPVAGNGAFDNAAGMLSAIPDSPHFQFRGKPEAGMTIDSAPNKLTLAVEPIVIHLVHRGDNNIRRMGSAPAVLSWDGRRIAGRVIYEFVEYENWNRLTRTYWGFWGDLQAFYLIAGEPGSGPLGDLYVSGRDTDDGGRTADGFVSLGGRVQRLENAALTVAEQDWALGFYRWPKRWEGRWPAGDDARLRLRFEQIDHDRVANWIIGGFAMSIVMGEIDYDGRTIPVYGFGEFIK